MSATNFWNNFKNGFLDGMFFNSPLFGCFGGFNGFNNWSVFGGWNCGCMGFGGNSPSLFLTPDFNMGTPFQLMPDMQMPSANLNIDMSKMFNNNIWDNSQFSNNYTTPSISFNEFGNFGDAFIKSPFSSFTMPSQTVNSTNDSKYKPDSKLGKWNTKYDNLITKYAQKYDVDAKLVKALMKRESEFNPNAKSGAGAIGLMQLMPATAKEMGAKEPYNPEQNIEAGVKYLKKMLDKYNGNKELAVAAYNAGPGNVKNGKIPQNGETPIHVREVMKNYRALA